MVSGMHGIILHVVIEHMYAWESCDRADYAFGMTLLNTQECKL